MDVSSIASATTVANLEAARSDAQINVLKRANNLQADAAAQLLAAQTQQMDKARETQRQQAQQLSPAGQPGSVINVYA